SRCVSQLLNRRRVMQIRPPATQTLCHPLDPKLYFMNLLRSFLLLSVIVFSHAAASRAQMFAPPISGVVFSDQRGPVGGVTVSLVHPLIGRSAPVLSGPNGTYFFVNIPPQCEPFFIEAYWGS